MNKTDGNPLCVNKGGSLRHLPSLRELDLSCNKKLSGGLSLLAPHLAQFPHLESLSLHLCYLTHTDLASLSKYVGVDVCLKGNMSVFV